MSGTAVLSADEPGPVQIERCGSLSPFLIVCDHAGRRVPRALGCLGLPAAAFDRHIAWDIGALGVALRLGERLDATVIAQRYSRLVVDCNRAPGHPGSIATVSEETGIPGNAGLSADEAAARIGAIFTPYHAAIAAALEARAARGEATILLSMHSFTPIFLGRSRPWVCGVLHDRQPGFSLAVLAALRREPGLCVGDNEPYRLSDASDYTVPVHAEARGLDYLEFEVRQDLVGDAQGQAAWAARLDAVVTACLSPKYPRSK